MTDTITVDRSIIHNLRRMSRMVLSNPTTYGQTALQHALELLSFQQLTLHIIESLVEDIKQPPVYGLTYETEMRQQPTVYDRLSKKNHPIVWRHAAHCPTTNPIDLFDCARQHQDGDGHHCEIADGYHDMKPYSGATGRYRIYAVYANSETQAANASFTVSSRTPMSSQHDALFPPIYSYLCD